MRWQKWLVNVLRVLLGALFVFSGFVKAIDPLGTAYKVGDYFAAWGIMSLAEGNVPTVLAVALIAFEFMIGIYLVVGIRRRFTTLVALLLMLGMTGISLYVYIANPISDCGCFGDAIKLSNAATFYKNIPILLAQFWLWRRRKDIVPFITQRNQWIVAVYSFVFIGLFCLWTLRHLPIIDFRPYKIGVNIAEAMQLPEGAKPSVFETTFIYEKDGKKESFDIDHLPDSTWTFVDSKTQLIEEGDKPAITDFLVADKDGNDMTQSLLSDTGYVFLLISPRLETADDGSIDRINTIYDYAADTNNRFVCITASSQEAIDQWRDLSGAAYEFYKADDIVLKTMIRSNPGLILLKGGTIINKWSNDDLPASDNLQDIMTPHAEVSKWPRALAKILLWYVLPLVLTILADRIWITIKLRRRLFRNSNKKKS